MIFPGVPLLRLELLGYLVAYLYGCGVGYDTGRAESCESCRIKGYEQGKSLDDAPYHSGFEAGYTQGWDDCCTKHDIRNVLPDDRPT